MGKTHSEITSEIADFIRSQHMYFVATAPLAQSGHVNLSPKGLDSFRILGSKRVCYIDYSGSGIETIAHIRENERLTIMFCAFDGPPRILRLYGAGRVVEPGDPAAASIISQFAAPRQFRAIVLLEITRIADSCGFGVPLMEFKGERELLTQWAEKKGPEALADYHRNKNARS